MGFFTLSDLDIMLDTLTVNGTAGNVSLMSAFRQNLEALLMLAFDTGVSGSATENPPDDTTGVLTDSGASYAVDEHNGRTLLITSGLAKGDLFTIDDTTATTLICTDDNLYSKGVRSGDTYKIFYDLKANADGHDHDGVNSTALTSLSNSGQIAIGTYTGDGAVSQAITGIGLEPQILWIYQHPTVDATVADDGVLFKIDQSWGEMAQVFDTNSANAFVRVNDNRIISLDVDGFTVDDDGADAHPNKNGQVYDYLAMRS